MSLLQSILMGIIQGLTEFLPVSSSGHLALFKNIFNINTETGLLFDTMLHLGTLVAVCIVYWKDVKNLFTAAFQLLFDIVYNFRTWISSKQNGGSVKYRRLINSAYKKFVVLILITTIPTGIMGVAFSSLIEKASQTKGSITGLETGFTKLDHQLSGLQPSDMILIAARPSVGKTAFVLNITETVAVKHNIPVAIFSLEMSSEQLINRIISQNSMVSSQKMRNGDLSDSEWANIVESANIIGNSNIIIDDTPGISIGEMRSKCRKFKLEKDIQLVIVDYLQLMTTNGRASSREQEIAEISRTLKGIARELNVPVIALSQLNRAAETREDKKPIMADLRESGSIEQDADVVMLMSRFYDKETKTEDRNRIIVNVAKQRNGPVGEVELVWLPQYTKFENAETEQV